METEITIIRPDDWHAHLRDSDALKNTAEHHAKRFGRAIIMPNLTPEPVTTVALAAEYRKRILGVTEEDSFEPLMTLYLTDNTTADTIREAKDSGFVSGVKLYPAGATTNSDKGVTDVSRVYPILEVMEEVGIPLLVHGEVTDPSVDVFDREKIFIERILTPVVEKFPTLGVVVEHLTTKNGVDFVLSCGSKVAATITVHHLVLNRNDLFRGGLRPHHYCLPVLKRVEHQRALQEAAISGNEKFFLGTDSAPHPRSKKESDCGCAGVYTAPAGIELYAEVFDELGALDKLEGFASRHGPLFYGLPANKETITLVKEPWKMPSICPFGKDHVVPFRAGEEVAWKIV